MFRAVIIDDEKIARRTLEKYLNDYAEGFEITASFSNGEGAIEYLKENDADVVFTDIKMPGMSGIEVAKWIYENKSHIKVVMVSGYSDFQYAQEAMKYKAVYYLLKVIDISEFKEVIGRLEKEIRKEKYASNYVDTETFFCNLLCGLFKTEENMYEEFARCCSVPKESAMCRIITVKFDESEQFLTEKWHYDKDMFRNVVSNIIKIAHKQCFTMLINQNEYEYRYILLFSKDEEPDFEAVDFEELIGEMISEHVRLTENKDVTLDDLYHQRRNNILDEDERNKIINSQSIDENYELKNSLIANVVAYINDNYDIGITVNDITVKFHVSRSYLTRQFKEITGKTITEYMIDIRMKKAVELAAENISTENICKMIGYIDVRNFRRLFQRYTGKTIQEYKNSLKKPDSTSKGGIT